MRFRRHMPPLRESRLLRFPRLRLPPIQRTQAMRWLFWLAVAGGTGYVVAAVLVVFMLRT